MEFDDETLRTRVPYIAPVLYNVLRQLCKKPRVFPKHEIYVSELLFTWDDSTVNPLDPDLWERINDAVEGKFGLNLGADGWEWYWLVYLDRTVFDVLEITCPKNLTQHAQGDADTMEHRKMVAAQRFVEYRQAYRDVTNMPLTGVAMESSRGILDGLGITCKSDVFIGCEFFMPRSTNIIRETLRWQLELLIKMHGGDVNLLESLITNKSIVLATGDDDSNLWRIPQWYKARLYKPELIFKCIQRGKRLDSLYLDNFEYDPPLTLYKTNNI